MDQFQGEGLFFWKGVICDVHLSTNKAQTIFEITGLDLDTIYLSLPNMTPHYSPQRRNSDAHLVPAFPLFRLWHTIKFRILLSRPKRVHPAPHLDVGILRPLPLYISSGTWIHSELSLNISYGTKNNFELGCETWKNMSSPPI